MEVFSYHLIQAPVHHVAARLLGSPALRRVAGLRHGDFLLPMRLGQSVMSPGRYHWSSLVFLAYWEAESALADFLERPVYSVFARPAWHIRMRLYRRWGTYAPLDSANAYTELTAPEGPVVGLTLARLRLSETLRFARFGKPVEAQVRDHPGMTRATVGFRPLSTFSTFSIWRSEADMLGMVRGVHGEKDGTRHRDAMVERARRPFHHEFTTMRLVPLSEHGTWPEPFALLPASGRA